MIENTEEWNRLQALARIGEQVRYEIHSSETVKTIINRAIEISKEAKTQLVLADPENTKEIRRLQNLAQLDLHITQFIRDAIEEGRQAVRALTVDSDDDQEAA